MWLALLGSVAVGSGGAGAATTGFIISPAFQTAEVPAAAPGATYSVQLTNATGADQTFRLSVTDFGSLDEEGGVAFLGVPTSELEHRYGLASWIKLEKDVVVVPAGKTVPVVVTLQNRPSLGPGGHYGAVLATAITDEGAPVSNSRVGVRQVLSSLILLTKEGGLLTKLTLTGQETNGGSWRLATKVDQRFQNTGNVHLVPRGVVEVRDPARRVVARGALNEDSGVIMPESFRRFTTPLSAQRRALLPGRYTVVTTYRFDGSEQTQAFVSSFWYAGALLVWGVGLLVVGVVIGVSIWLWRRRRKHRPGRS